VVDFLGEELIGYNLVRNIKIAVISSTDMMIPAVWLLGLG